MKKLTITFIAMVLTLFCGISVFAAETDDSGMWEYQTYGVGVQLTKYNGTQTDVYVPSKITKGDTEYSVLKLGDNLFKGNTALNSATLGEGITEIGASTFEGATNLVCIVTPESLTTIGTKAFSGCTKFNSVILYDTVTSIGQNAFEGCGKVTIYCNENKPAHNYALANKIDYEILNPHAEPEIYTIDGVEYYISNGEAIAIGFNKSTNTVTIPATIEGYPVMELKSIFYKCDTLTNVNLPESLKVIGDNAFYACSVLKSITIPDSVTSIGDYAFSRCYSLKSITISDSLTNIGEGAFYYCSSLSSITIPGSVTSLPRNAFSNCSSLSSITIPDSVTSIGENTFYYCSSLSNITIPDSVTNIGESAFSRCSLINITIPDSVTSIKGGTFLNCTSLSSITIPDSVTSIERNAFYNCDSLKSITIPDSVTSIGEDAFYDCTGLATVIIPGSVTNIYSSSFAENTLWLVYENSKAHTVALNNDLLYLVIKENEMPETYKVGGVTYYISNGEAIAIGFDKSTNTVTIPATIEGYPVTELKNTFYECYNTLTHVTLPEGLKIIGDNAFYACSVLKSITIPDSVTSIGRYAFSYCDSLSSITIPDSVTSIEERAFYDCDGPKSITIPDSVTSIGEWAFASCDSLSSITIPDSLTSISNYAFNNCDSLKSITIPDGVTSIGEWAFSYCDSLSSITIPNSVTSIPRYAFSGCFSLSSMTIPDSVTSIEEGAFSGCSSLKSMSIPDSVTSIGEDAFYDCAGLATVIIPESVTNIYSSSFAENTLWLVYENSKAHTVALNNDLLYFVIKENEMAKTYKADGVTYYISNGEAIAIGFDKSTNTVIIPATIEGYPVTELRSTFYKCDTLASVTLPDSLKIIGDKTFFWCYGLSSITIPDSVTSIGDCAFSCCESLSNITIPDSVTSIGRDAFSHCESLSNITIPDSVTSIPRYAFSGCSSLKSMTIPDSVTSIGEWAFSNCSSLSNITIPDSVTSIGEWVFSYCYSLSSITIPDSVTGIESNAFYYCTSLSSITIPDSVTSIGEKAFYYCTGLSNIKIPSSMTSIGSNAFNNCTGLATVIIPKSVTNIYSSSFAENTLWLVYENSKAHTVALNNDLLYFVLRKTENPEISYGSGISGTAKYTDGTAASGATVELLYDDGTVKESVTTDANGNYEFTYAEVGRYTIRVTDAKGNTASEVVSVKRMNVFDVYLTGETDLVLKKGYTVSGTVSPAIAKITLSDTNGNKITSVDTSNGAFAFTNIPRGSYIVKAENENGSATTEIYVSNEDVTGISLTIQAQSASVTGATKVENRDGTYSAKIWVNIDLIDANGNVVASTKTDSDGKYTFKNVPAGSYNIVATTNEMRPDIIGGFDKNHELKGYGHIDVTEFITYSIDTIVLREDKVNLTSVSGKVTANGTTQDCQVILTNETGDQIAVFETNNNGKYNFVNIPDGMYCITAITKNDGMGFAVITVENGVVYGDTDIKVAKADKISKREETLLNIPDCNTKLEALLYKEAVLAEKTFYDSLSDKERKQLSEEWIEKLFKLVDLISNSTMNTTQGVIVENEASIISPDEIDKTITFTLTVEEATAVDAGEDGITSNEEYETEKIKDKKGKDKEIAKYYDITFAKDGQNISNIQKQTETNGKLLITMEIPEEFRGHKHYSFIHMHKGEAVTLVDLDNNPNTVTFEIDKFSTFALAYSDTQLVGEAEQSTYPATVFYNPVNGKISVSTKEAGKLYVATFSGKKFLNVNSYDIPVGTTEDICDFGENQAAFMWKSGQKPLSEKFTINN